MAQVIINLEPDEILRAFTTGAQKEGFRLLLRKRLEAIPGGEPAKQPGARRYGRTGEHTDSRNNVRRMSRFPLLSPAPEPVISSQRCPKFF